MFANTFVHLKIEQQQGNMNPQKNGYIFRVLSQVSMPAKHFLVRYTQNRANIEAEISEGQYGMG